MTEEFLLYNRELNTVFIHKLNELSFHNEQAHKLMSHVINAQHLWNARIQGETPSIGVWDIHSPERMLELNTRGYQVSKDIVQNLGLETSFTFNHPKSGAVSNTVGVILMQVANHGTHHRAQIALLMRQTGHQPPIGDYIFWKRNQSA